MTVYPEDLDDDRTIIRIDDNISELGGAAINQLREAVFSIEKTLGTDPQGSKSTVDERISVLIAPDGQPRAETLAALGLITQPIHNNQVADTAGIEESKLALDYGTSSLNTQLAALETILNNTISTVLSDVADLKIHISGGEKLSDNITLARHVASHIDLNNVPLDVRDTYTWTGLLDKDGVQRTATHVAEALLQINDDFVSHQNATTGAHPATAITVDSSGFTELPADIDDVQEALDFIDNQATASSGLDRAILHSNGIPRTARAEDPQLDGYNLNIIPVTSVAAFLAEPTQTNPRDSISNGDTIVKFNPSDNSDFSFDALFTQVNVGDLLRINYGNGLENSYPITSIRFSPGLEWVVRINTYNLANVDGYDGYDGYARIDRSRADSNTWGVLAAAGAVPDVFPDLGCGVRADSVILGSPRGATAVGLGFDPAKLDEEHYLLYLRLYTDGTAANFVDLPGIDVTGNAGVTPGKYDIERVVEQTNLQFRQAGYNFRFIAFNQNGEFGIMLADHFNNSAFSIISGDVSGSTLIEGAHVNNVIGDATDGYDALGLGTSRSGFASPIAPSGYTDAIAAANFPTRIIAPVKERHFIVNGTRRDFLATQNQTEGDGYWLATITDVTTDFVNNTKIVEYNIPKELPAEEFKSWKTVVIQPTDPSNTDISGYGRFIIGAVTYGTGSTTFSVINGVHGDGDPIGSTLGIGTTVKVYLTEDSVPFNKLNLVGDTGEYHRYHEVFVNNIGESFSVERLRMPKQTQAGLLLDTQSAAWRLRNCATKLKGYERSDFRSFIRFTVLAYNSTTGEFDGYLSDLNGQNSGPITRGKKDNPVRFYDNTFVNFIDIEFREDATNPGTSILPDTQGRYVDIEVFSSLGNNDEYFAVAGVSHDDTTFRSITDLREFGTLSEKNFTNSAKQFIQAGERYLHANGVVRGFEYEGVGLVGNALEFTGGTALVNGAFVSVDSLEVHIPIVKTSTSDTVEYFICVTEGGQLKAVIKDIGQQFFEDSSDYFVETLTFAEIIDKRKDLTIIAKVTATIPDAGTGTPAYDLVEVTDARRHIINQDLGSYTWAHSDDAGQLDGYNANFITTDALMNWVNEYDIKEVKVKYISTVGSAAVSLSFNNHVTLKGGVYELGGNTIRFESGNWLIDRAKVFYYPSVAVDSDFLNVFTSGLGAFVVRSTTTDDIINFGINNTSFFSNVSARTPFVSFHGLANTFENGTFKNNTFEDTLATNALAYAFINASATGASAPTFKDIEISGNKVSDNQGLLISGLANESGSTYSDFNRSAVDNFVISNNVFGFIGTMVEGDGLIIEKNKTEGVLSGITAKFNSTNSGYGLAIPAESGYAVSCVIRDNFANYIKQDIDGSNGYRQVISGNRLARSSDNVLTTVVGLGLLSTRAISLVSGSTGPASAVCSDNVIDGSGGIGSAGYAYGIYAEAGITITGNTIINMGSDTSFGIFSSTVDASQRVSITGNTLHKIDSASISAFISAGTNAMVTGNSLSHYNVDDAGGATIDFGTIVGPFAAHNYNQAVDQTFDLTSAIPLYEETRGAPGSATATQNNYRNVFQRPSTGAPGSTTALSINRNLNRVQLISNGRWEWVWSATGVDSNDGFVGLIIPVASLIPPEAILLKISITFTTNSDWACSPNSGSTDMTPEMVMEVNGSIPSPVAGSLYRQDLSSLGTFTLIHDLSEVDSTRPSTTPYERKEIVIRARQNPDSGVDYGGWPGPDGAPPSAGHTLTIRRPEIVFLY